MRRALVLLSVVSACAAPHVRTLLIAQGAADVREATVEVVNATGRDLPAPRPGLVDQVARVTTGGAGGSFSGADAFAAAAVVALREKGVGELSERHARHPVLRVALLDFEIRDHDASGAVAFVSAKYALLNARDEPLWEALETRLPIRLGGPDLTRSELYRIATEAVERAFSSFPEPKHP